jgi:hypothetical protein
VLIGAWIVVLIGAWSGEIAYMIDGLYIRNPIYGGIGSGTRLNLFAVK